MNNFNKFQSMTFDELVDWLDKYGDFDFAPWNTWWDKNYCSQCEPVDAGWGNDYAWCECNNKCKYFQDMDEVPDHKFVIKMWLESEAEVEDG